MTDGAGSDDRRKVALKASWFRELTDSGGAANGLPAGLRRALAIATLDRAIDVVVAERERLEDEARAKATEQERIRRERAELDARRRRRLEDEVRAKAAEQERASRERAELDVRRRRTHEAEAMALAKRRLGALGRARREGAEEGLRAMGYSVFPVLVLVFFLYFFLRRPDGAGGAPFAFWIVYFLVLAGCGLFWGLKVGVTRFRAAERKAFR